MDSPQTNAQTPDERSAALIKTYTRELQDEIFIDRDWGNLLTAAPLALGFVGQCMNVSASPGAQGIRLQKPQNGFQYLKYDSLHANLQFLTDEGRSAFTRAHNNMADLFEYSQQVCSEGGRIDAVILALSNRESTREMLPETMEYLRKHIDRCKELATDTEAKFDLWLNIASELSQVATQSRSDTHNTLLDTGEELEITKIVETAAQDDKTRQEEAVKEAQRQMEHAEKQLETATQQIPSGWDTIGKTFVEGLTQSFFSLADVVTTKYGAKHGVNNSNRGPGERDANTETVDRVSTTHLVTLGVCLQLLAGMVEGPEHTPDWDQLLDCRQGGPGKVAYLEGQLRSVMNAIDDTPKLNIGTQEVKRIVDEALKILYELKEAAKKQKELGNISGNASCSNWTDRVAELQRKATQLSARGDTIAGNVTDSSLNLPSKSSPATVAGSIAQAEMRFAAERYQIAQEQLRAQRDLYDQKTSDLTKHLGKILDIKTKMQRLDTERLRLSDIIKILQTSMQALSRLKTEISRLLAFFRDLSRLIHVRAGSYTDEFLTSLDNSMKNMRIDGKTNRPAEFVLPEFRRQVVLKNAIMIRACFMVIQDTADVYTIISKAHILPGLELVEQSGWSHNGDGSPEISMAQRMHKLDEFVDDAVKKVQRISDLRKKAILGRMDQRLISLGKTLESLPAVSNIDVIESVVDDAKNAAVRERSKDDAFFDNIVEQTDRLSSGDDDDFANLR